MAAKKTSVIKRQEQARRRRKLLADVVVPDGWNLSQHYASDMTECGCETHMAGGISAVAVVWRASAGRWWMRCTMCGAKWSRRIVPSARGDRCGRQLCIDGSHPEERAARLRRKAKQPRVKQEHRVEWRMTEVGQRG